MLYQLTLLAGDGMIHPGPLSVEGSDSCRAEENREPERRPSGFDNLTMLHHAGTTERTSRWLRMTNSTSRESASGPPRVYGFCQKPEQLFATVTATDAR